MLYEMNLHQETLKRCEVIVKSLLCAQKDSWALESPRWADVTRHGADGLVAKTDFNQTAPQIGDKSCVCN